MVAGAKDVEARLVAMELPEPGSEGRPRRNPWACEPPRSSPLGHIPGHSEKWGIWSLDIRDAFSQVDGFGRDVF